MNCPMCGSSMKSTQLLSIDGKKVYGQRCQSCGGFWFDHALKEIVDENSINRIDVASPNYSLKHEELICPRDSSLLKSVDRADLPAGIIYWTCRECEGYFYPKGQLAMISKWQHQHLSDHIDEVKSARTKAPMALILLIIGGFVMNAAVKQSSLQASADQVLPTSGPSILTLLLLGVTYLAGTVLAVLGRRIPIVLIGWSVILICLTAFSAIIFGP